MMNRIWRLLPAMLTLMVPLAAVAEAPLAPPEEAAGCELHIFPTTAVQVQTYGLLTGGGALFYRKSNATNSTALLNAIDADTQARLMGASDITSRLGIPAARIVVEPAVDSSWGRQRKPEAKPATACYYELHVGYILVKKSLDRLMEVEFSLDDYDHKAKPKSFTHIFNARLKLFPPGPGEDLTAANDDAVAGFKTTLDKFTEASRAKLSKTATGQN